MSTVHVEVNEDGVVATSHQWAHWGAEWHAVGHAGTKDSTALCGFKWGERVAVLGSATKVEPITWPSANKPVNKPRPGLACPRCTTLLGSQFGQAGDAKSKAPIVVEGQVVTSHLWAKYTAMPGPWHAMPQDPTFVEDVALCGYAGTGRRSVETIEYRGNTVHLAPALNSGVCLDCVWRLRRVAVPKPPTAFNRTTCESPTCPGDHQDGAVCKPEPAQVAQVDGCPWCDAGDVPAADGRHELTVPCGLDARDRVVRDLVAKGVASHWGELKAAILGEIMGDVVADVGVLRAFHAFDRYRRASS